MNQSGFGIIGQPSKVLQFIHAIRLDDGSEPAAYFVSEVTHQQLMANGLMTLERLGRFIGLPERPIFDMQELADGEIVALSASALEQVRGDLVYGALPKDSAGLLPEFNDQIVRVKLPL